MKEVRRQQTRGEEGPDWEGWGRGAIHLIGGKLEGYVNN